MRAAKETDAMVRSNWIAVLVLALTGAGEAWAQESRLQPVPQAASGARTMTVQERGKAPLKCRILLEWRLPSGSAAYKVQALDTGDVMTIAENPSVVPMESLTVPVPGSATPLVVKTMTTKIYHWGQSATSPPGAPVPPGMVLEMASPGGQGLPAAQSCDCQACQEGASIPGSRPLFPKLRQALTGRDPSEYPETMEMVTEGSPSGPVLGSRIRESFQSMFKGRTPGEVVASSPPAAVPSTPPSGSGATAPPVPSVLLPADRSVSDPSDWRKSWGQPVDHKSQAGAKLPEDKTNGASLALPPTSVTETERRADPLVNPDKLVRHAEDKLATDKPSTFHPFGKLPLPAPGSGSDSALGVGFPGGPGGSMMPQAFNGKMPLGAQSVLAAGTGPYTQIQYLPVPVVTVPPVRPPSAPYPGLPQPPQPPMYVNAFTPGGSNPMAPPSAPLAFGQNGYPLSAGFGPYPRPGLPPAAVPQQMPPNVAVGYQGPTPPPYPFSNGPVVPASYTQSAVSSATVNPAMDRRSFPVSTATPSQPANSESLMQLTAMLRDSLYPSQRVLAAEGLTNYDWHYYPQVVQALLAAAREDPAPLVRASCVSCFVKMNVKSQPVLNVLGTLRNDNDPGVRQEAEQALARLH